MGSALTAQTESLNLATRIKVCGAAGKAAGGGCGIGCQRHVDPALGTPLERERSNLKSFKHLCLKYLIRSGPESGQTPLLPKLREVPLLL